MSDETAPPAPPALPLDGGGGVAFNPDTPPVDHPDGDEFDGDPGGASVEGDGGPATDHPALEEVAVDLPGDDDDPANAIPPLRETTATDETKPEVAEAETAPAQETAEAGEQDFPKTLAELSEFELNIEDPNNPEKKYKVSLAELSEHYTRAEAVRNVVSSSEGLKMEFAPEKIVEAATAIQNSQGARDIKGGQEQLERFQADSLKPHLDKRNAAVRAYHAEVERAREDGDGVSPEISTKKDDLVDSYGRLKVEHERLKGEQAQREDAFSTHSLDSIWEAAFPGSDIAKDSTKRAKEVNNVSQIVAQRYNMSHRELAIAAYQNPGAYRMLLDVLSKDASRNAGSEAKLAGAKRVRELTLRPGSTSRQNAPARGLKVPTTDAEGVANITAAHAAARGGNTYQ